MPRTIADVGGEHLSDAEKQAIADEWNANLTAREAERAAMAAVLYRRLRARDYRDEMGAETGDFVLTIGDVLDTILGQFGAAIAAGEIAATPEMTTTLAKRAGIKARHPKPQ